MKQIIIAAFTTVFLMACNSQGGNEKEATTAGHKDHGEHTTGLALNDGAKWKADSATNNNVAVLKTIVARVKTGDPGYKQTADELQQGLNKMIAECKMKGPDHDALHKWLEPLIEKIKVLKNETAVEKADTIFKEIEEHINLFTQYFE